MARNNLNPDYWPLIRLRFARAVTRDDSQIHLTDAALLIANEEYPELSVTSVTDRLTRLALAARDHVAGPPNLHSVVQAINEILFEREGLSGNVEDYYDPRNSFLNDVLDRKLGIPISLSIIYLELGRRLGLPIFGVGLPGHFIVVIQARERILIDPFDRGAILSVDDCAARVQQSFGDRVRFQPAMLQPLTNRQILARLLANLKGIYTKAGDYARALAVADRLVLLNPDDLRELRDRALIGEQCHFESQALADFARYLSLAADGADQEATRSAFDQLRRRPRWRN